MKNKYTVTILSNPTNAMCYAFICNKSLLPSTLSSSSKSSKEHTQLLDENAIPNDSYARKILCMI
jgi:hypothetical protein